MKPKIKPIPREKEPNAWIFDKDGLFVAFALEETTITLSLYPSKNLKKINHRLENAGYRIAKQGGTPQIIREKEAGREDAPNPKEAFLIRVGKALMNTFLGSDWDTEIKFTYPAYFSEFTKRVLEETRKIPKGQVATYGEIAERIGSPGGARAVGNALGKCPLGLIVPCHRVVNSKGRVGFLLAREILMREGVKFRRGRIVL
ncbi:MAG: MGMT family protein [Candidatus Heimdallarchaeota archaeon]